MSFFGKGFYTSNMAVPLADGMGDGNEIEIFGMIPQNANKININLIPSQPLDNITNICLNIKLKVRLNMISLNSMQDSTWDEEQEVEELNMPAGENFSIKIACEDSSFNMWTNGEELTTFENRLDGQEISDLHFASPIYISKIIYNNNEICMAEDDDDQRQVLKFYGSGISTNHFGIPLPCDFKPGVELEMVGFISENADKFRLNFTPRQPWDLLKEINFHFSARFSLGDIVRNSMKDGLWGEEEVCDIMDIAPGTNFYAKILATDEGFKMWINNKELAQYTCCTRNVNFLEISTLVQIKKISLLNAPKDECPESKSVQEGPNKTIKFFGNGAYVSQMMMPLPDKLIIGSEIEINGIIPKDSKDMILNIVNFSMCKKSKVIGLHLRPRFRKNIFIVNAKESNTWGDELKERLNFTPGCRFNIKVLVLEEGYEVWTNGEKIFTYPFDKRIHLEDLNHMEFETPFIISEMIFRNV